MVVRADKQVVVYLQVLRIYWYRARPLFSAPFSLSMLTDLHMAIRNVWVDLYLACNFLMEENGQGICDK